MIDAGPCSALIVLLIFCLVTSIYGNCESDAKHLVYSFTNRVGAANFTYFKLHKEGIVCLELFSSQGDADLYISSATMSPDYKTYEYKSATCGVDFVEIPLELSRPVGIGVYGHPTFEESEFVLSVYADDDNSGSVVGHQDGSEKEESVLWSLFVGILKILIDVLV